MHLEEEITWDRWVWSFQITRLHQIAYSFNSMQIQIMSVGVQLNPVATISGDEVCKSAFDHKINNEIPTLDTNPG